MDYDITMADITSISHNVWKNRVSSKVASQALLELKLKFKEGSKTKHLEYQTLQTKQYVNKIPSYLATILLRIRSNSLSCKVNQSSSKSQNDRYCRLCNQAEESQEHIINCHVVSGDNEWITLHQYKTLDQHQIDETKLRTVYERYTCFLDKINESESEAC